MLQWDFYAIGWIPFCQRINSVNRPTQYSDFTSMGFFYKAGCLPGYPSTNVKAIKL